MRFGVGYAPDEWQPLAKVFNDYSASTLETAGLVIAGEGGKRYDRFRDRIMFSIHDGSGRVIVSAARARSRRAQIPEFAGNAPVLKGRELYGLFRRARPFATPGAWSWSRVMDVVALAQHGVDYTVAAQHRHHRHARTKLLR